MRQQHYLGEYEFCAAAEIAFADVNDRWIRAVDNPTYLNSRTKEMRVHADGTCLTLHLSKAPYIHHPRDAEMKCSGEIVGMLSEWPDPDHPTIHDPNLQVALDGLEERFGTDPLGYVTHYHSSRGGLLRYRRLFDVFSAEALKRGADVRVVMNTELFQTCYFGRGVRREVVVSGWRSAKLDRVKSRTYRGVGNPHRNVHSHDCDVLINTETGVTYACYGGDGWIVVDGL